LQAQLIEDILDVSRIIRGKLNLNICQVNLIPIIEAAIDTLRLAAVDKEIQLDFVMDSSLKETDNLSITPLIVSGDPSRLQQVVWNLLSNAIKFTPAGGSVEVELSVVRKELSSWNVETPTDSYAQIKVSDTGVGISADFLPYIFDRFRQADSTTTRRYGGLGLGLAIVRHLVELQGGTVFAQSEGEDQGATFIVNLPLPGSREVVSENKGDLGQEATLSPTPNSEHPITPSSHHSLTGLQVLVVDDDTDTRDFLTTVLEEYQVQVTAVASVQEALLALEHLKPDVLVSDIGMPMEDGYGLIRKVRSLEAEHGETIPAIALSGYAKGEERSRSLEAGFQTHLPKPVQPAELIAMVAQLAQRENISDLERSETNT
jgi:CheY-like chemotaxis protein